MKTTFLISIFITVILSLHLPANISADVVKLKNGATIDGVAREEGNRVIITIGLGTVSFDKSEVDSIEKKKSAIEEYNDRWERIKDSRNPNDFYNLAKWAETHKVYRDTSLLYRRAIELNPNHEQSHKALGHELYQERWMTHSAVMTARGFILFRGTWTTSAEKELIIAKEKENTLKQEIARQEEKERQEEERLRKEEERRLQAQIAQLQQAQAQQVYTTPSNYGSAYYTAGGYYYGLPYGYGYGGYRGYGGRVYLPLDVLRSDVQITIPLTISPPITIYR